MSLSNLDKLLGMLTITSKEFSFPLNYILLAAAFLFFYGIFYGAHLVVSGLARFFWEL
jgi:hypothetical protein